MHDSRTPTIRTGCIYGFTSIGSSTSPAISGVPSKRACWGGMAGLVCCLIGIRGFMQPVLGFPAAVQAPQGINRHVRIAVFTADRSHPAQQAFCPGRQWRLAEFANLGLGACYQRLRHGRPIWLMWRIRLRPYCVGRVKADFLLDLPGKRCVRIGGTASRLILEVEILPACHLDRIEISADRTVDHSVLRQGPPYERGEVSVAAAIPRQQGDDFVLRLLKL